MVKYFIKLLLFAGSLVIISCSKEIRSEKVVTPDDTIRQSLDPEEAYRKLRSKWTIRLNSGESMPGKPLFPSFSDRVRGDMGGIDFPVQITATFMDNQVIEAGLTYYEKLTGMTPQEADSFRQDYQTKNELERYFLIEVLLQTSWTEDYLNLDRWVIFLEDDQGNKYEPEKVFKQPLISRSMNRMTKGNSRSQPALFFWELNQKNIFLYFSRIDYYGREVMHENLNWLKIVFRLEKGGTGRAEGSWIYQKTSH
jgi:hypothetical protein